MFLPELPLLLPELALPELPLFPLLVELVELVLPVELPLVELPLVEPVLLDPLLVEVEVDVDPVDPPVPPPPALARLIMLVVAAMLLLTALPTSIADTEMPPPMIASIKAYSGAAAPRLSAHHFFMRLPPQTADNLSFYIEGANGKVGGVNHGMAQIEAFSMAGGAPALLLCAREGAAQLGVRLKIT